MKFFISFFLFTGLHAVAKSQTGYSIKYERESLTNNYSTQYSRFVYNDSFSFYYYFGNSSFDPFKKQNVFSKKIVHHAVFCDKKAGLIYDGIDYPEGNTWLVRDSISPGNWIFLKNTKTVLNYECNGALKVTPENDSILIWYTKDLGNGLGYPRYPDLPGIPLEIYDQSANYRVKASKIDRGNYEFILPKEKIISRAEYYKIRNDN